MTIFILDRLRHIVNDGHSSVVAQIDAFDSTRFGRHRLGGCFVESVFDGLWIIGDDVVHSVDLDLDHLFLVVSSSAC